MVTKIGRRSKREKRICLHCKTEFYPRQEQVRLGNGLYCSRSCASINQKEKPLLERFWSFVKKGEHDECWEFMGCRNVDGYGSMSIGHSKIERAHRISFVLHKGEIPPDMVIMHTCDNPPCCNPKHLILGTQIDNIHDMVKKKRLVNKSGESASRFTKEIINDIRNFYTGKKGQKFFLSKKYKCAPTTITNILNNWNKLNINP